MRDFDLLVLDYEAFLLREIKARDELIKNRYASGTVRKEYRIYAQCLGEFRKIANAYEEAKV